MTLFLLVYDPTIGRLVSVEEFGHSDRHQAEFRRLQIELEARAEGLKREIVILEAAS